MNTSDDFVKAMAKSYRSFFEDRQSGKITDADIERSEMVVAKSKSL